MQILVNSSEHVCFQGKRTQRRRRGGKAAKKTIVVPPGEIEDIDDALRDLQKCKAAAGATCEPKVPTLEVIDKMESTSLPVDLSSPQRTASSDAAAAIATASSPRPSAPLVPVAPRA